MKKKSGDGALGPGVFLVITVKLFRQFQCFDVFATAFQYGKLGLTVAVQDGTKQKSAKMIRVAGEKVLVLEGLGKLKVYSKLICRPVPLVPHVTVGDRVQAPRYGQNFASATVSKFDSVNGRVFVRFDGDAEEKAIAFGDVWKN